MKDQTAGRWWSRRQTFWHECGGIGCDWTDGICTCPKRETRRTYKAAIALLTGAGKLSRHGIFWPGSIAYRIVHFERWWRELRIIHRSDQIPF